MGAMIGAMFMGNLKFFMPVYMILNLMVLIGFSYMIFQEIVFNHAKTKHNAIAPWKYVLACVVITIFLMVLIDVSSVMRANMMAMMAKLLLGKRSLDKTSGLTAAPVPDPNGPVC